MSCFKLTKKVCKALTSCMAKYWWGSSLDRRSMHWLSWKKLSAPKINGGMGFRDFEKFNLAMLGKHGWRMLTQPNSLCARVLKGKYFPNTDFLQATIPRSSSAIWRAIIAGRSALETGLIKRVVNGSDISVWTDRWIPGITNFTPSGQLGVEPIEKVSELIDGATGGWKVDMVWRNFFTPEAEAILNIPLRAFGGEDFLAWALERSGNYSVKSAYRALTTQNELRALEEGTVVGSSSSEQQLWIALWKLKVIPKIRVFWWRVLRGILPDSVTLKNRHIKPLARCEICTSMDEDLLHALVHCPHAKKFCDATRGQLI